MKQTNPLFLKLSFLACLMAATRLLAQNELEVRKEVEGSL